MKVSELREALAALPPTAEVLLYDPATQTAASLEGVIAAPGLVKGPLCGELNILLFPFNGLASAMDKLTETSPRLGKIAKTLLSRLNKTKN